MSGRRALRLRIRLLDGVDFAFGPGKADLLRLISETGSISAAGRAMGMSYKKAWTLVDEMNRAFALPVVEAAKGGQSGGGARLTPHGDAVLERYRSLESRAEAAFAAEVAGFAGLLGPPAR